MTTSQVRLSIAFTTRLLAEGLESVIQQSDKYTLVFSSPIGKELFSELKENSVDQILILEVNCPGKHDLELIHELLDSFPFVRILLISHMPRVKIGKDLIESGISAYLLKVCTLQDLRTSLQKITDGKPYFCSDITRHLFEGKEQGHTPEDHKLTEREKEVLGLLVQSYSNKQIADRLNLSENTIKTHRRNIFSKFGASNLLGMVHYAYQSNLVGLGFDGYCADCPNLI